MGKGSGDTEKGRSFMIVVSDTTILSGLIQIDRLDILRQIYGKIIIPEQVYTELRSIPNPALDLYHTLLVDWIDIRSVSNLSLLHTLQQQLDKGEAEALALAVEVSADLVLIDELRGRAKADELGLTYTGLLGTLKVAKVKGYINAVKPIIIALQQQAGMWYNPKLIQQVLVSLNESM